MQISVPAERWFKYVIAEHAPVVRDVGDQRDPILVVFCKCITDYSRTYKYDYAEHLAKILEQEYFTKITEKKELSRLER